MKQTFKTLAVVLVGAGLVAFAAAPAVCSDDFCPMGGTLVKAEVDKDKAIEWGKDRKKAVVTNEDGDDWSVLTLGKSDDDIAILVTEGAVFFGIAGEGREVGERDLKKVFGKDLDELREAVKKEMKELWKTGAVKIEGSDVQKIANAVGLGTLEKDRDWELTTQDCTGMELDASDLD